MTPPRRRKTPAELVEAKDRANEKRRLRRFWAGEFTFDELCDEMQMSPEQVKALAEAMGLGPRREPECYLPTPQEIRLATAEFRAAWTPAELEARLQGRSGGTLDNAPRDDN